LVSTIHVIHAPFMVPLQAPVELFGLPIHPVEVSLPIQRRFIVGLAALVAALSILLATDLPKGLEGVAVGLRRTGHDGGDEDDQGVQGIHSLLRDWFSTDLAPFGTVSLLQPTTMSTEIIINSFLEKQSEWIWCWSRF
jgi:hypothetical protein